MIAKLISAYRGAVALLNHLQSPLLLAIRLYWGFQFGQDGWGKLHNLDRVTSFFATLNLPAPHLTALSVSIIEFAGGILLAAGIVTRLTSLVLFVNMTVAFWVAEKEAFLAVLLRSQQVSGRRCVHVLVRRAAHSYPRPRFLRHRHALSRWLLKASK